MNPIDRASSTPTSMSLKINVEAVQFDVVKGPKGWQAENIEPL